MTPAPDARLHAPAAERNREPILTALEPALPGAGLVLEIASGTGQHVVHFAARLAPSRPDLRWQPTDVDPAGRASIEAWIAHEGLGGTVHAPLDLDVTRRPWPVEAADAVYNANLIHISPWECGLGLLDGAAAVLRPGGLLFLYGPYRVGGRHTAPSNEAFDRSLRGRDPRWGVRDLEAVRAEAEARGLAHERHLEMPANNLAVLFRRR